jgi:hypothetical protein
MRRGKSVLSNSAGYFNPELPPIVLGTMALRGVYAVFDMDTGRVGLASKQGLAVNSKNCAAAVQVTTRVYCSLLRLCVLRLPAQRVQVFFAIATVEKAYCTRCRTASTDWQ